ncbi:MAG: ferrochelatase [Actinomycetota bacterium]
MTIGVLAMAYGSPESLDDVGAYLREIRSGREVSEDAVAHLRSRYEAIGGPSPLNAITSTQASKLQQALDRRAPGEFKVAVGMKHWRPAISDGIDELINAQPNLERVLGLALAPHYSQISIGGYASRVRAALPEAIPFQMIDSWYQEPSFIEFMASRARAAGLDDAYYLFTAHSLPASIIDDGDPYLAELTDSAKLVAAEAGIARFEVCFQSASKTGVPWLGPDLCERVRELASTERKLVVVPIGFVSDHLEILYDIDVEATEVARSIGIDFTRTELPNEAPEFIEALADVVQREASR